MYGHIKQNAHAVIFPAVSDLSLSESVKNFLLQGGCSILIGETREEYVARQMSRERRSEESADTLARFTARTRSFSGDILIAVDQEIAGICRLHNLVEHFPPIEELQTIHAEKIEILSSKIAAKAIELGINCFLGPILDIVTGANPWLKGRTWSKNPQRIAKISSAYIRGIQSRGVAAAAKHFPGYSNIKRDPAIYPDAIMTGSLKSVEVNYIPFRAAVENGVEIIMTGPAVVEALDPDAPASLSPIIINLLKEKLKFKGLVLSDDLDARATLRGNAISDAAVGALNAGADLLLIADVDDEIQRVANGIIDAVRTGQLPEERLYNASEKVRSVAHKYRLLEEK